MDIWSTRKILNKYTCKINDQKVICEWLVPQVEWDFVDHYVDDRKYTGFTSDSYCAEWELWVKNIDHT
jgi:hypothetical protein